MTINYSSTHHLRITIIQAELILLANGQHQSQEYLAQLLLLKTTTLTNLTNIITINRTIIITKCIIINNTQILIQKQEIQHQIIKDQTLQTMETLIYHLLSTQVISSKYMSLSAYQKKCNQYLSNFRKKSNYHHTAAATGGAFSGGITNSSTAALTINRNSTQYSGNYARTKKSSVLWKGMS